MAVGGAAYLVSKAIRMAEVVAFADLGMEAIYEFEVVDMPVTVAVDAGGTSVHTTGPAQWRMRTTVAPSHEGSPSYAARTAWAQEEWAAKQNANLSVGVLLAALAASFLVAGTRNSKSRLSYRVWR